VNVAAAVAVAGLLAAAAGRAGWFTVAGAATGGLVAGVAYAGAGWSGLALLALFVVSGSALPRVAGTAASADRGPRRAAQVLANGWTAALGAALVPAEPAVGWALLSGGLAAAQADTWATEIGSRGNHPAVLVTTGEPVPAGTSGGITARGTIAGVLGAAIMGGAAGTVMRDARTGLAVTVAGIAGMMVDSLLGGTVQLAYRCPTCRARVDGNRHCGIGTRRTGGCRWITNDVVNALATGVGGGLAVAATAW
jgi:uncharacterized protein (TIGR00297 family)